MKSKKKNKNKRTCQHCWDESEFLFTVETSEWFVKFCKICNSFYEFILPIFFLSWSFHFDFFLTSSVWSCSGEIQSHLPFPLKSTALQLLAAPERGNTPEFCVFSKGSINARRWDYPQDRKLTIQWTRQPKVGRNTTPQNAVGVKCSYWNECCKLTGRT